MRGAGHDLGRALLFLLAVILGSTAGSLIFLHLPVIPVLSNPREIVSPLTEQNFSPLNNQLRFALYFLSGLGFWALAYPLAARWRGTEPSAPEPGRRIWSLAQLFLLALALVHVSLAVIPDLRPLDLHWFFHEGEWLAPAMKWARTGELWTGSFFAHGAFYDALAPALSWKLFGESIAASRVLTTFLEKITYLPLMAILAVSAHFVYARRGRYLAATFTALFLATIFLLTRETWQYFERRDFPALLSFLCFLQAICFRRPAWMISAGLALGAAWVYSIDRGVYVMIAELGCVALLALITRDFRAGLRELTWLLAGLAVFLALFGAAFGFGELLAGFRSTARLFAIKDLSDGSVYPAPGAPITNWKFLRQAHTLPLVCLLVQLLAFASLLRRNRWRLRHDPAWLVSLAFLLFSFAYFRGALSRCDELHYRYVSSFAYLGASLVVVRALADSSLWRIRFAPAALCLIALGLPLQTLLSTASATFPELPSGRAGLSRFLATPDESFTQPWQLDVRDFLAREFREEPCFASIVSEPLWVYLLKKPHCGKFHLAWLISDKGLQLEAIEELRKIRPGKVLVHTPLSGDEMDGIPIERRARYLFGYIEENYRPAAEFKGWEVWKRKH